MMQSILSKLFSKPTAKPNRRRRALPRVEALEDRLPPATDIQLQAITGGGANKVSVRYEIVNEPAAAFQLEFFRSANNQWDAGDLRVSGVTISAPADLSVGIHVKTFTVGTGAGKIALPGAGAADPPIDYFLLAAADAADQVAESDADPQNEDNTAAFQGAYHLPKGLVLVHGTQGDDVIVIGARGLTFNGKVTKYLDSDVSEYRVRAGDGNDLVRAPALGKRLKAFGGDGNDILIGGRGNDLLGGGNGDDFINAGAGNDLIVGSVGQDVIVPKLGKDAINWSAVLAAAAAGAQVSIFWTARLSLSGRLDGCSGGGPLNISGSAAMDEAGNLNGSFSATGSGSFSCADGSRGTFQGSAAGVNQGPLSNLLFQGTANGNVREVGPDGIDNDSITTNFTGRGAFTSDVLRVNLSAEGTSITGQGDYRVFVTNVK